MALQRLCGEMLDEARLFPETEGTTDHVFGHALRGKPAATEQFGGLGSRKRTAERISYNLPRFRQKLDQEFRQGERHRGAMRFQALSPRRLFVGALVGAVVPEGQHISRNAARGRITKAANLERICTIGISHFPLLAALGDQVQMALGVGL